MDAPGAGPGASARGRALGPQPAALGCHALVAGRRARDGEHQGRDDQPAATGAAARAARGSGRGMAQAVAEAAAAGLGRRLGDTLEALAEAAAMARARRVRNLVEAFAEAAAVELLRRLRERLEAVAEAADLALEAGGLLRGLLIGGRDGHHIHLRRRCARSVVGRRRRRPGPDGAARAPTRGRRAAARPVTVGTPRA